MGVLRAYIGGVWTDIDMGREGPAGPVGPTGATGPMGPAGPALFWAANCSTLTTSSTTESASFCNLNAGPLPAVPGMFVVQGVVACAGSVAGDAFTVQIKNAGASNRVHRQYIAGTLNQATLFPMHINYVTTASQSMTITVTALRVSGTGTLTVQAGSFSAYWYPT